MCLILLSLNVNPKFPFVVAANRDEFFARPTAEAEFGLHQSADPNASQSRPTGILAGKDLQSGGTWLGITSSGRFAAVTNIRHPALTPEKPRSRGELTSNFLSGSMDAESYLQALQGELQDFAGFNLIVGDVNDLFYLNNQEAEIIKLEAGTHGLSNGLLNSRWPKVQQGKEKLRSLLGKNNSVTTDELIQLMKSREAAEDHELPDTGISIELERQLSSAFIANPGRHYGTRCSTAITVDDKNTIRFSEQNYKSDAQPGHRHYFEFERIKQ